MEQKMEELRQKEAEELRSGKGEDHDKHQK